jgi:hypothetical protein
MVTHAVRLKPDTTYDIAGIQRKAGTTDEGRRCST